MKIILLFKKKENNKPALIYFNNKNIIFIKHFNLCRPKEKKISPI